ncbi:hypothetical protein MFLO_07142 [Listeria floridensis FSL S10-1187]|uniref:Uncharacterized protein n=1 Tax=Listeria floridensis FSL S10-1187 TaxID=1265817 RepID=A0ABP3B123_9LIST|nr:hypothetical protein [Listeria floridensis]EUJ32299.1 hypothetical protein MFLO_07142 [Listeria floridensis FSL S10-1187]
MYVLGTTGGIKGNHGEDVFRVRLFVNGVVKAQAQQPDDQPGMFLIPNADPYIRVAGKEAKVELVAVDKTYREVNRIPVTVK